jgi:WD40 repeat protein
MQIPPDKHKLIRLYGIILLLNCLTLFLKFQLSPSTSNRLSPFNQIFLLTELQSKILLKNTISETGEMNSVAITPDGQVIVSRSKDNTIKVWNLKTGKLLSTIAGNPDKPKIVIISPDLQTVASSCEDGIEILDLKTGKLKTTLPNIGKKRIETLAFSPDGQTLVSNSEDVVYDPLFNMKQINTIEVWNLNTGKLKTTFKSDKYCIESLVAISQNGQMVMSCRDLGWYMTPGNINLKIWDVNTGKLKTTFSEKTDFEKPYEKSIDQLTISADGQTFVTRSGRKTIKTWDINTGSLKATLPNPNDSEILAFVFSPDGQTLLTNFGSETKILNLKTGSLKTTIATGDSLGGLAISPDLQTLVSSSSSTLQIWDLKTGKYKTALVNPNDADRTYINSIAISPDGQTIVSSYRNLDNKPDNIKIWQMP